MKKRKIIGAIVVAIILIGLIVFASVHSYSDSHLRAEGVRVRVSEYALVVDGCDEGSNSINCNKTIKVGKEEKKFNFAFQNFRENGYPNTIVASLNGKEFYREDGLKIEEKGSADFRIFLNFHVIADKYIAFTFTKGSGNRVTTLYVMDTEGNIVLEEYEIDTDDMKIKDSTEFIEYNDAKKQIKVYATRVIEDINYHEKNVCYAKDKTILEAYYTYTLKNDKFVKKQTETISAKKFIENKGIKCAANIKK